MEKSKDHNLAKQLRDSGHKATPGRLAILKAIGSAAAPVSILDVSKKLGNRVDRVTIYRALEALTKAGLVRRIDLQHPHTHYELSVEGDHHHHLVCKTCDAVEDINDLDQEDLEKLALKKSKLFNTVSSHSLEFFGMCKNCAQKSKNP